MGDWIADDLDIKEAVDKTIGVMASDLGESPEAWRGAMVMLGRVGQIMSTAIDHGPADMSPARKMEQGAAVGLVIMTAVATKFEKLPLVVQARKAQGWPT